MKIFYGTHRNIHHDVSDLIIENLLLHHVWISTLDFTADSPLMTKHTIPIPLLDTSQRSSLGKWRIASCALVLTLGPITCFAQTGSEASAQPATVSQPASPDVAKELDAMKKRIEQLESQIAAGKAKEDKDKDKDKQATAAAAPAPTTATNLTATAAQPAAAPSPATPAAQAAPQQASAERAPLTNVGP